MDIEITGYRVLYSESIAGRGVARLKVGWAQQGQLTALIEYLTANQSLSIFIGRVLLQPTLFGPTLGC